MNDRQARFIDDLRQASSEGSKLYAAAFKLKEQFDEEFSTGQANDLNNISAELADIGLTYADIQTAANQYLDQFQNFWTGAAVASREYGADARRVGS